MSGKTDVLRRVFRASEALYQKVYVESLLVSHGAIYWQKTFYRSTLLNTNVVNWTDANGLSGIPGGQNPGNLYISLHARFQLVRPSMPSSARGSEGEPRRFTEVVLNEQALRNQSQREVTAIDQSPDHTRGDVQTPRDLGLRNPRRVRPSDSTRTAIATAAYCMAVSHKITLKRSPWHPLRLG